jgi:phytanoyl-CoA hydroxylase
MVVSSDAAASFARDGFAVFDRLLSQERVYRIHAAMDRVYRGEATADRRPPAVRAPIRPFGDASSVRWVLNARVLDAALWELACDPRLGELAAALLGTPSVSIIEDQLLDKPPAGVPVNMHQDYAYWPFSRSTRLVSCWIALVDMTPEHGPLELVRGSHRWGQALRPRELVVGSEGAYLEAVEQIRPPGVEPELVPVLARAGGGVFFDALTLHGSRANRSPAWRRACSLHWAAEECTVDRSKLVEYDYPYFFAGLTDGGRIVNRYMPRTWPPDGGR